MRRLALPLAVTCALFIGACSVAPASKITPKQPDADKLLVDAGLPTNFWHKTVIQDYKTEDGWDAWIVSGDEMPKRAEDGECVAKDFTWVVAVNPENDQGILYSDDAASHNPEIGFILNDDVSKYSVPCDQINFRDYFLLSEYIEPHQAVTLMKDLKTAVICVQEGLAECGKWKKLNVTDTMKGNFLKLPGLPVSMIEWGDRDKRDWIDVRYMLYPPTKQSPYFIELVCSVRTLVDGSLELDVTEGGPDP